METTIERQKMSEMTSRERVMTTIRHQQPDRVPLYAFSVDPKIIRALGDGNPLKAFDMLGLDSFPIRAQNWCQGVPLLASLVMEIPEDMQTGGGAFGGWDGIDEFGRVWKRGSYVGGDLRTWEDLEKYIPPLKLEERTPPEVMRKYQEVYPHKAHVLNMHSGPFGLTMESMGFEDFFYTLSDDRDLVQEVITRRTDWFIEIARYVEELGADYVVMGDDVAYKGKTFVSPDDFRELALPAYRKIVDALDIPVFWHSDGFIEPVIDIAVEAGIRGLHAMEPPAGNDLGRIKKKYGEKMVLMGNVDCVNVLTTKDLDLVRADVDRCMREAKAGGGFMLASSNSLHSATTLEAVVEMYRYAKEVGKY
jgi:uroporphyrinogen decarboxylase